VSLIDTSFFDPGSATLKPSAVKLLRGMAPSFLKQSNEIRVEGHTDNVPCHSRAFPSNWELSATRAAAVVRFFSQQGIAKSRLSAVGYADTKAITTNGTPDGRKRNRRVEIVLVRMPDAQKVKGSIGGASDTAPKPAAADAAGAVTAPPQRKGFSNPFEKGGFKNPFGQ
jgi:chemotaxis protein MotB